MVKPKSSALSATHDTYTDFSSGNGLESNIVKFIGYFSQLLSRAHIFHRREVELMIIFFDLGVEVHVSEELVCLFKIDALELS